MIGQGGGHMSPSTFAKLVKFAAYGPVGTTAFTNYSEIWHNIVHHDSNLMLNFALIGEGGGYKICKLENLAKIALLVVCCPSKHTPLMRAGHTAAVAAARLAAYDI